MKPATPPPRGGGRDPPGACPGDVTSGHALRRVASLRLAGAATRADVATVTASIGWLLVVAHHLRVLLPGTLLTGAFRGLGLPGVLFRGLLCRLVHLA